MPDMIFIDLSGPSEGAAYVLDKSTGRASATYALPAALDTLAALGINDALLSLPLSMLDFRRLTLPVDDPEKVRRLLQFELEGMTLADPAQAVIDAVVLGPDASDATKFEVLAVYLQKDALRPVLEAFAAHGIDPRAACSIELSAALGAPRPEGVEAALVGFAGIPSGEERIRLAWREASSGPRIDLRRDGLKYTVHEQKLKRSALAAAVLALLLVLATGADMGLRIKAELARAKVMEDSIRASYAIAFPTEKFTSPQGLTYKFEARIKELQDKVRNLKGVRPLDFLSELKAAKGLTYTDILLESDSVTLKGRAASLSEIQAAQSALQLSDIKLAETSAQGKDGMPFTITAKRATK